jgi:hypothetical protein
VDQYQQFRETGATIFGVLISQHLITRKPTVKYSTLLSDLHVDFLTTSPHPAGGGGRLL